MLLHISPPIITLNGCHQKLELYSDRVVVRPTGWRAKLLPLVFGEARMVYLDEVTDIGLCPVRFRPDFRFRLVISNQHLPDVCVDGREADFALANAIIDCIENFMEQGAFLPPAKL